MKFDYLDIGTCNFETSLDLMPAGSTALMVEPLFHYLTQLPNLPGVIKAPFAISNFCGYEKIFHVPFAASESGSLPYWVKGCNSFSKPHPTISSLNNVEQTATLVPVLTLKKLCEIYQIDDVCHFKVDTEGHDHIILEQLMPLVLGWNLQSIQFEYLDAFANTAQLDLIIDDFKKMGYRHTTIQGDNLIMTR